MKNFILKELFSLAVLFGSIYAAHYILSGIILPLTIGIPVTNSLRRTHALLNNKPYAKIVFKTAFWTAVFLVCWIWFFPLLPYPFDGNFVIGFFWGVITDILSETWRKSPKNRKEWILSIKDSVDPEFADEIQAGFKAKK